VVQVEPPVAGVEIRSGAFHPYMLELDPAVYWIVRWTNTDPHQTYVIALSDDLIESPPIPPCGSWQLDVSKFTPGIHRYAIETNGTRAPGVISIEPAP
jgi:hypothetical protein